MKPRLTVIYGQGQELSTSFQTGELARHLVEWFEVEELKLPAGATGARFQWMRLAKNYLKPLLLRPRAEFVLYANDGLADLRHWRGRRILYWYDAPEDWSVKRPRDFKNRLRCQNVIAADEVFAVSAAQVELARRLRPGREESVHYLPVGVDCAVFDPQKFDREAARRELGLRAEDVVVGYLGYLGRWGGRFAGEMLLEAMALVPKGHLLVIGRGPALEDWKRKAVALGMLDRIHFAGFVAQERLAAMILAADICVDTLEPGFHSEARSETKLKQYMAMGRACVATAIGENIVDLDQGRAGVLVGPSAKELAGGIQRLMESAEARERLGKAARERAKDAYDWRGLAQRMVTKLR